MKKKLLLLCIIVIFVIILLIIALMLLNIGKNENDGKENSNTVDANIITQDSEEEKNNDIKEVTNAAMYFSIKDCVDNYIKYISNSDSKAIYNILDDDYIKENNITEEDVIEFTKPKMEGENLNFRIDKMLVEGEGEDIQKYYIKGYIRNLEGDKEEYYLSIIVDINALVFSAIPNNGEEVFNEN